MGYFARSLPPAEVARAKSLPIGVRAESALRSSGPAKTLNPKRLVPRTDGARAFDAACSAANFGNDKVADALGLKGDKAGAEARSGAIVLSFGEAVFAPPLDVSRRLVLDTLRELVARARVAQDSTELRLTASHIDAVEMLIERHLELTAPKT